MLEDRDDGAEEALAVHEEAADATLVETSHIVTVQSCLHRNLKLVPSIDLRPAGETGAYIVGSVLVTLSHQVALIPESRAGADNTHIPDEDVPNLWEFIETVFAQNLADARDVLLWIFKHVRWCIMRRGYLHGAELVKIEQLFVLAHTLLGEEGRTGIIHLDGDDKYDVEPGQAYQPQKGEDDIEDPFEEVRVHDLLVEFLKGRIFTFELRDKGFEPDDGSLHVTG